MVMHDYVIDLSTRDSNCDTNFFKMERHQKIMLKRIALVRLYLIHLICVAFDSTVNIKL